MKLCIKRVIFGKTVEIEILPEEVQDLYDQLMHDDNSAKEGTEECDQSQEITTRAI